MAKNQRQRRPLQDETRQTKQTVRERAQASRRQRDRIEENRDRREQRRERARLRRQTVDSVRSPKEDVRTDRFDSRLTPVEDTFLGRPVGMPTELPVLIGERWGVDSGDQIVSTGTTTLVNWGVSSFTTERNGYPALLVSSNVFRIPAGLAGVWYVGYGATWSASSTAGSRIHTVRFVSDNPVILYHSFDGENQSGYVSTHYLFQEGDEFEATCFQDTGGDLTLLGGSVPQFTYLELIFKGK